ncbi:MAG: hypothetical protein ACE5HS_07880 [bacterium]
MSTFPGAPRLVKGGIVLLNPNSLAVLRVISFQYNPETLTRTLEIMGTGADGGDRSETLRLKGAPAETIKVDVEIDATDQLEFPGQSPDAVNFGILPQLDVLETIVYPASRTVQQNNNLANVGTLEISPVESPLALFVWSAKRVLPVRLTEFSITEEFFNAALNPIRAKVSLGMRVLNTNDLQFSHKASNLFMVHHQQKEQRASKSKTGLLLNLGISRIK